MSKLRLRAESQADLEIIAAAVQDAILRVGEINYDLRGRSLTCLLYTSPSPRDATLSRMPSSA